MAERNVHISITGDSSDLSSELKKVGSNLDGLTDSVQGVSNDARKALDGLGNSASKADKKLAKIPAGVSAAGRGAKPAANNVANFADRLDDLSDNAGESSSIMAGLAGAFGIISPEAQAAATGIADAAGGLEAVARSGPGLVSILGPVAVAVGALGLAYVKLTGDLDEANKKLETQKNRLADVVTMADKVKEAVLIAGLAEMKLAESRGDATRAQVEAFQANMDEIAIAKRSNDLFGERRETLTKERDALIERRDEIIKNNKEDKESVQTQMAMIEVNGMMVRQTVVNATATKKSAEERAEAVDNANAAVDRANRKLEILSQTENRYIDARKRKIAADQQAAKATAGTTEADKNQTETIKATEAALASLEGSAESARFAQLEGRQLILATYDKEIEAMRAVAAEHENNAQITAALQMAEAERRRQLGSELREFDSKNEAERVEEVRASNGEIFGAMGDLAAASGDAFMSMGTAIAGSNKQAAQNAFKVGKALSTASISVKFAESLMAAQTGGPILGPIQAGIATATFATAMARIAATKPAFHTGTGMVRAPSGVSEMNARLRDGEAVTTPLGAEILGRDNIERANAGMGGGSGSAPVVFQYEHRQFSRFIRDSVRMRGPLATESETGRTAGHRSR